MRHIKQIEALRDQARFNFWLVGRRGGKTIGMREDLLENVPFMNPGYGIYYIGPTNADAMELMWDGIQERLDHLGWSYTPRISNQRFKFSHGRYIQIIGAEKLRRVRGRKIHKAYLDEVAFFSKPLSEVWRALRPALSDAKGGAIVGTTPAGKGTDAYDFYLRALTTHNWKYTHWHTIDNPFIDPEEIEEARKELDEKSFRQEYLATWESFDGLVYYSFDENLHIKPQLGIDPNYPIEIAMDFNVNPTTLLVIQDTKDKRRVKKEYSIKNSSTPATVQKFCEDHKQYIGSTPIYYYGDSTGGARKSNIGESDYYYVEDMLKTYGFSFQRRVPGKNPGIIDRVAFLNGALKNTKGESRIEVDPSCVDLIRDLGSQAIEGRHPSPKHNLGHKGDALGYYIYFKHVIEQRGESRMIRL